MLITAAAVLGVSACGGGGGATTTEAPPATTPSVTATTPTGDQGTGASETTSPGATLKIGDTAHVDRKPLNATAGSTKTYPLDVTVLKIEKGSIDDFENVNLDADQKQATPYYVTVRIASTSEDALPADDDPDLAVDGIDDRGQRQGSVTFIGDFPRCKDAKPPAPFTNGASYESCLAFLIGGGGAITEVRWTGSDKYILEPVVWR